MILWLTKMVTLNLNKTKQFLNFFLGQKYKSTLNDIISQLEGKLGSSPVDNNN